MDVECPLLSRAGPEINKGKGLARNVQLFKGLHKKHGKKHLTMQEMSDYLKSMTDVIIESKSVSNLAPFTSTAAIEVGLSSYGNGVKSSWGAIKSLLPYV
nr:hypothetical protein CFP56_18179 [Quercus suber]